MENMQKIIISKIIFFNKKKKNNHYFEFQSVFPPTFDSQVVVRNSVKR